MVDDGSFAKSTYISIGDPYSDRKSNKVHELKDKRQFLTSPSKLGQTGGTLGSAPRSVDRLFEGEPYQDPHRMHSKNRLENTQQNLTPNGFRFSNPMKVSSTAGDYFATFSEPHDHIPDGTWGKRGKQQPFENFEKRQILGAPGKTGGYGTAGNLIGGEIPYEHSDYDTRRLKEKRERASHVKAIGERKPFKGVSHKLDYFDTQKNVAASRVYTADASCKRKNPSAEELMTPKERAELHASDGKPFKPSSPAKTGGQSTFDQFPEHSNEPYSEQLIRRTLMPQRLYPASAHMSGLPTSIQERRPFKPTSTKKTRLTRSIQLMGIHKHKV